MGGQRHGLNAYMASQIYAKIHGLPSCIVRYNTVKTVLAKVRSRYFKGISNDDIK